MAKAIAVRAQRPTDEVDPEPPAMCDASLTSDAAYAELESSARLIPSPAIASPAPSLPSLPLLPRPSHRAELEGASPAPAPPLASTPRPEYRPQPELVTTPPRSHSISAPPTLDEPRFASRNWRAEAWERERERELRAMGKHPNIATRRASNA
ncbi:MAG TPA: hypothetical protein VGG45_14095 [Terracidiphilus sp.]